MPSADSSPSPPPRPPTALMPGHRASTFVTLYNNTLAHTLKSISYESFASCFPTIAEQTPESLKGMHKNMTERLEKFAKDEFETILRERNVVENLNMLEDLIADAKRRKSRATADSEPPIPPHLLPASAIASAHMASVLASQQSQLNAKLQTTQSQNAKLAETLAAQRLEIERLLSGVETVVRDLDGATELLANGSESLAGRAIDAEVEMTGF